MDIVPQKRCSKCREEFPATPEYFYRRKASRDGLQHMCKRCDDQRTKKLRNENPDREHARRSFHYYKGRSGHLATKRAYYRINRDRIRQEQNDYHAKSPMNHRARRMRRKARKLSLPDTFTMQDWFFALDYFDSRCAVCGRTQGLWHKLACDHWIPLAASTCPGTVSTNMIPLCHGEGGCNNLKNARMPEEWLIERYGKRKAKAILERIEEYFRVVINRTPHE